MAEVLDDEGPMDSVNVPPIEEQRQIDDLNDEVFDFLLANLASINAMFRDAQAAAVLSAALKTGDNADLVKFTSELIDKGYNRSWELLTFVRNLRKP